MSKRTTSADPPSQDVESQSLLQTLDAAPVKNATSTASALDGGSSSSPTAGGNPILLAKMVLRKVLTIVMSDDDETAPTGMDGYGAITLLKDVFVGTVFGLVTISFLIFLDHINIIHLQSAHNFRESAFAMLNDPETLSNLEEAGLKFIPMEEYDSMMSEINEAESKLAKIKETLVEREKEGEEKQKEVGPLREQLDEMVKNGNLGLDKWCGDCKWNGGTSCESRKEYFISQYGHSEISGKFNVMKSAPQCKKE